MDKKKQLMAAIGIFVVAFFVTKAYIDGRISEATPKESDKVVVAKKGIRAGDVLLEPMMKVVTVPRIYAPKEAIRASDRSNYAGQTVGADIVEGDYIMRNDLDRGATIATTLAKQIGDQDFRGVTIPVDETNSFARSIVSGDKVDVLFTFNPPFLKQKVSTVLLQNALVIATGSYSPGAQELGDRGGRGGKYATVTLKLPAIDAVRLNYARQSGQINLLLRSDVDNKKLDAPVITGVQDVLNASDKEALDNMIKSAQANYQVGSDRIADQIRESARAAIEQGRRQTPGAK